VFEITDEGIEQPAEFKFLRPAGIDFADGRRVQFNTDGPIGGKMNDRSFANTIHTEAQYPQTKR
jgi:hypothetical protein